MNTENTGWRLEDRLESENNLAPTQDQALWQAGFVHPLI